MRKEINKFICMGAVLLSHWYDQIPDRKQLKGRSIYGDLWFESTMTKEAEQHRCGQEHRLLAQTSVDLATEQEAGIVYKPQDPSHGVVFQ